MPPDVQPTGGEAGAKAPSPGRLGPGSKLAGGRFEVEALSHQSAFGEVYRAREANSGRAVSIHLVDSSLASGGAAEDALRASTGQVGSLEHEALSSVLEVGSEGADLFVVTEGQDAHTLRQLLARKQQTGHRGFSPRGAYNLLSQILGALSSLGEGRAHGTLSLDAVLVNNEGKARITDFGFAPLAPAASTAGKLGPSVAPEVVVSGRASPAADVYSAGAIVYEILVGSPPVKGCQRPSQAVPGLPSAVDQFVGRCMSRDPAKRPATLQQVKTALGRALAASGTHSVQSGGNTPPPSSRPSLAQSITAPPSDEAPVASASPALSAALADGSERWLISKGKLDYGPFTLAQVVEQIQSNQVLPGHTIVDSHTGERQKVEDHPLLFELVEEARHRRDEQRRAKAELAAVKQEKRRGTALYVFVGLGVLALGGAAYFVVDKLSSDEGKESAGIASLQEGSVAISASSVKAEKKRGHHGGHRSHHGGASQSGGGWDDPLNLGDVSEGGESERLSNAQINPVIQKHGSRLAHCLLSSGSRSAHIKFIIKGSGHVSWVSVNGSRGGALYSCVSRAMKGMKFPSFNGPRTRATFDMNL